MVSSRLFCCVAVVAIFWGISGCGGSDESASSTSSEAAVPSSSSGTPGRSPGVTNYAGVPEGFPADVPEYPNGTVLQGRTAGESAVSLVLETDDSMDDVAQFYSDGLAAQGWSTELHPSVGGTAIFADKGTRKVAVSIATGSSGKTQVNLIVSEMPF